MKVLEPLEKNHPIVSTNVNCWICDRAFLESQRVVLLEYRLPEEGFTTQAKPVHATCALRGKKYPNIGIVDRVKDGDASPYPVVMTNGRQFTLAELRLE